MSCGQSVKHGAIITTPSAGTRLWALIAPTGWGEGPSALGVWAPLSAVSLSASTVMGHVLMIFPSAMACISRPSKRKVIRCPVSSKGTVNDWLATRTTPSRPTVRSSSTLCPAGSRVRPRGSAGSAGGQPAGIAPRRASSLSCSTLRRDGTVLM